MSEISILMVLAAIIFLSPYIANLIKFPISPTEIILGIIFGAFGLLPQNDLFEITANVGFYFLMFLAGTHVNIKIFITTDREILKKSITFLAILYILSFVSVYTFDLNKIIAIIIPTMSVGLLSTLYKEYGKDEKWLNTAMVVGVIGEVVSIAIITVASAYLKSGFSTELFTHIFALALFLIVSTLLFKGLDVLFWWYPNLKAVIMPTYDKNEKDIRFTMAIFCFVIAVMIMLDLEIVIGAFIAGTFIPTFFGYKKDLPRKLANFGYGFIVPIFFAYIGSTLDVMAIWKPGVLPNVIILIVSMLLFRILAGLVYLKELGKRGTVLFALSLYMPLTLIIATVTVALNTNNITKEFYDSCIIASLLEAIIAMILIKVVFNLKIYKNKNIV